MWDHHHISDYHTNILTNTVWDIWNADRDVGKHCETNFQMLSKIFWFAVLICVKKYTILRKISEQCIGVATIPFNIVFFLHSLFKTVQEYITAIELVWMLFWKKKKIILSFFITCSFECEKKFHFHLNELNETKRCFLLKMFMLHSTWIIKCHSSSFLLNFINNKIHFFFVLEKNCLKNLKIHFFD